MFPICADVATATSWLPCTWPTQTVRDHLLGICQQKASRATRREITNLGFSQKAVCVRIITGWAQEARRSSALAQADNWQSQKCLRRQKVPLRAKCTQMQGVHLRATPTDIHTPPGYTTEPPRRISNPNPNAAGALAQHPVQRLCSAPLVVDLPATGPAEPFQRSGPGAQW